MKLFNIILIIIFMLPAICFGENWYPVGKQGAEVYYKHKPACESSEGQACFDVTTKDPRYHVVQNVTVDDMSKPLYKAAYNTFACDNNDACLALVGEKNGDTPCDSGDQYYIRENTLVAGYKIECSKVIGYEQIVMPGLVEDAALKAAAQLEDQSSSVKKAKKDAVYKNMAFGKDLKVEISLINIDRNLNSTQIQTFTDTFESVNRLLDAGAIATAKTAIEGLVPDEVLLRAQDKTIILDKINAYLAQ